jgi:hypothetical protein
LEGEKYQTEEYITLVSSLEERHTFDSYLFRIMVTVNDLKLDWCPTFGLELDGLN